MNESRKNAIARYNDSKWKLVEEAKSVPCVDCGVQYPWWVMDLDHVRGTKDFPLAHYRTRGYDKIKAEIAKCDPVCANCHRERTHARRAPKYTPPPAQFIKVENPAYQEWLRSQA